MTAVIAPVMPAASGIARTGAAVAAQPIDEKASAKVASRDEVWRRRNWLRRACTRDQSWIAVAEAAETSTAIKVTVACTGARKISPSTSGVKIAPITSSTTSILARMTADGDNGAVA